MPEEKAPHPHAHQSQHRVDSCRADSKRTVLGSGDALYLLLAKILDATIWGGALLGADRLPDNVPAVFVANHVGALGPIAVTASLPIRVYPWIAGEMLDWLEAGPYLRRVFVEPILHVPSRLSMSVSKLLSKATVRLLRYIKCVPVWSHRDVLDTYRLSVDYLANGRSLLIFPEDPALIADEQSGMRPFKTGFGRLGELYYERCARRLQFVPLAVLGRRRQVLVGALVSFNPLNKAHVEMVRIARLLESEIRSMVVGSAAESYTGLPLPR